MILGVIPARGGSKGIPRKNILNLHGKPLLSWSIDAAQKSTLIDRFVVSTDDVEIAEISKNYGAEVLMRPAKYATDDASTVSVLQHVLSEIDAEIIVLLQPTSPIRINNIIDSAIESFLKSTADTLATGYISHHYEWGQFENMPRQKMDGFFHDDGNIYIFDKKVIKSGKWTGDKLYRMELEGLYNIEIDDISEFWANEGILSRVLGNSNE
mgnify:CR=1 FL=1